MKYAECLEYLESLKQHQGSKEPGNFRRLCELLGNPQKGLRIVRLTGTNGKGSVMAYLSAIWKAAGYRTGCYPALGIADYRERIEAGGRAITKAALCEGMELLREACDKLTGQGFAHPAFWEAEAALAFWYFREKKCDIVILRSEAVKIEELLEQPLITVDMHNVEMHYGKVRYGIEKQRFDCGVYKELEIHQAGKYQVENAALAVKVADTLSKSVFPVKEAALRKGLAEAKCPGRFQVVGKKPMLVADGACNGEAAQRLAESIEHYFAGKEKVLILGFLKTDEYNKVIDILYPYAGQIITVTPPDNGQAVHAYELAQEIAAVHPQVTAVDSIEEAVEIGKLLAGKDRMILAAGTLAYIGRLLQCNSFC